MKLIDYLRSEKKETASIARERLQIIFAHERGKQHQPEYLPEMQQEILDVIRKYIAVDQDKVDIHIDKNECYSVLDINIILGESD